MKNLDYSLYFVTEESIPLDQLLEIVESAVCGGVSIVQLREKKSEGKIFYEKALRLKTLLDRYSIPLIINDRIDISLAVEAAGVHVGQSDLPLNAVRKLIPPSMVVGVSVANQQEALLAEASGADYVGIGSCFPTITKNDAKVLPKGMFSLIKNAVHIPVVAIGGIKKENIALLKQENPAGFAVVSAITNADNPTIAANELLSIIKK